MQEVTIKLTLEQVNILTQAINLGAMKIQMDWGILAATIQSQAQAQIQPVTEGVPPNAAGAAPKA